MLDSSMFFDGYLLEVNFPTAIIFIFLSVYTVLSNTLVCLVYLSDRGRNLRTISNNFIISLAVADILVGLAVEPLSVAHYWSRNSETLFWYYIFAVLSCVSSILHICAMMVDRYIAVSRPFRYRILASKRRVRMALVSLWLFALHFAVLPLIGWRSSGYQIYLYVASILIPLGVMFASYRGLLHILKAKTLNLAQATQTDTTALKKRIENEKRISMTVLIMMIAFLAAWCPFVALDFALVFCDKCRSQGLQIARDISLTLGFLSSGINPLLYAWRVPKFRRGLWLLLKIKTPKTRRTSTTSQFTISLEDNSKSRKFSEITLLSFTALHSFYQDSDIQKQN